MHFRISPFMCANFFLRLPFLSVDAISMLELFICLYFCTIFLLLCTCACSVAHAAWFFLCTLSQTLFYAVAAKFCHFNPINYSFIYLWFIRKTEWSLAHNEEKCNQVWTIHNRPAESIHMEHCCYSMYTFLLSIFSLFMLKRKHWWVRERDKAQATTTKNGTNGHEKKEEKK